MLKKGDVILFSLILATASALYLGMNYFGKNSESQHKILIIKQKDKIIRSVDLDLLSKAERIELKGNNNNIILLEKGRARFESANCNDKVCVKSGWLTKPGDIAVCLPNYVTIKITGQKSDVDIVTY